MSVQEMGRAGGSQQHQECCLTCRVAPAGVQRGEGCCAAAAGGRPSQRLPQGAHLARRQQQQVERLHPEQQAIEQGHMA